jgi:hypothetical protein
MATRPVFMPRAVGDQFVAEIDLTIHWHSGFAKSQSQKNISELHDAAKNAGITPVLEVSTKSENVLGVGLSAFNLKVMLNTGLHAPLESVFQGSKVFRSGGPYMDLYCKSGFDSKTDARIKQSGELTGFSFQGQAWGLEPKTAFYDWLYLRALNRDPELGVGLMGFAGFTDIAFNPQRSINCQARSCALYVSLSRRGLLDRVLRDRDEYLAVVSQYSMYRISSHGQLGLSLE